MTDSQLELEDGSRLDLVVRGEGPDLVLLHGWTAAARDWEPALEHLSRHFRCIAWNARPHTSAGRPGIERMAADLDALLTALTPSGAILCGHSMGALTALEYIAGYGTERLRALSLIDQSPRLLSGPDWPEGLRAAFTEADNRRFLDALRADFVSATLELVARSRLPESGDGPGIDYTFLAARRRRLGQLNPGPWIQAWESFIGKDYRTVLPAIDVPTLLVFGGRSRYYVPEVAEYMREAIPRARLAVYDDAGHGPHVEQPRRFCDDLRALAENIG